MIGPRPKPRPRRGEKGWADFERWCRDRGLRALPAHPWTVAAYLRWVDARRDLATVEARLRAIERTHLKRCLKTPTGHPVVDRTLALVRRRDETRGHRADLFPDDAFADTRRDTAPPTEAEKPKPARRQLAASPKLVRRRPGGVSG